MPKFYIVSGNFKTVIDHPTAKDAVLNALEQTDANELSKITKVSERGFGSNTDDDLYFWTVDLLEETGRLDEFQSKEWLEE